MASIRIRTETPRDGDDIDRVLREAFGADAEARLVRALRRDTPRAGFLSWVACADDAIVGQVLLSPIEVRSEHGSHACLALAPLAVRPAWQRRGIGTDLTREALAGARAAGHGCVLVLGDPAYYARFGFRPAAAKGIVPPTAAWAPNFMVLALNDAPLPAGTARYPATFDGV